MKKLLTLGFSVLAAICITSCGPHMYKTQSQGKENISYVVVLKETGNYSNVVVAVDGNEYTYGKVYKIKAKRKAHPVIIEPGKHHLQVIVDGHVMADENIFLSTQQTKTVVLR